ncbi:hypothetical protein [Acaryochloris sp. 'Moss Beach']|nr:hypothetical protein [Acaryochloris sp. 'Moss Beach']
MNEKTDKASWAKSNNSSSYQFTSDFFQKNPEFGGSDGVVQV